MAILFDLNETFLLQELKSAREAIALMEVEEHPDSSGLVPGSRAAAAANDMKRAVENGDREMAELRAILARKGPGVAR